MGEKRQVFISYSHEDDAWCKALAKHLGALRDRIEVWIDEKQIRLGTAWEPEIANALQQADLAILLVSSAFFDSDFIHQTELPKLLARRDQGLRVIAVRIRSSGAKAVEWLQSHGYFPRGEQTLSDLGPLDSPAVDRAFGKLVDEIADFLEALDRQGPPRGAASRTGGAIAPQDGASEARTLLVDTLLLQVDAAERAPLAEYLVATLARLGGFDGRPLFEATRLLIEHCLLRPEMPASPAALRATVERLGDSETARRLAAGLRQGARTGHFDDGVVEVTSRFFMLARAREDAWQRYFEALARLDREAAAAPPATLLRVRVKLGFVAPQLLAQPIAAEEQVPEAPRDGPLVLDGEQRDGRQVLVDLALQLQLELRDAAPAAGAEE